MELQDLDQHLGIARHMLESRREYAALAGCALRAGSTPSSTGVRPSVTGHRHGSRTLSDRSRRRKKR
jgi:hypothetical protein